MTKQTVVAGRIEFKRVDEPRLYSRRIGIDDGLQQAHDRFAVSDGMEIHKSEEERIALRCDKEPERIEPFALQEGGVQLVLNFSREGHARTFSRSDVLDKTQRRTAMIVIGPSVAVQCQVSDPLSFQRAVDDVPETLQIECLRNLDHMNRVVGVQIVPLEHGPLKDIQFASHFPSLER